LNEGGNGAAVRYRHLQNLGYQLPPLCSGHARKIRTVLRFLHAPFEAWTGNCSDELPPTRTTTLFDSRGSLNGACWSSSRCERKT